MLCSSLLRKSYLCAYKQRVGAAAECAYVSEALCQQWHCRVEEEPEYVSDRLEGLAAGIAYTRPARPDLCVMCVIVYATMCDCV